MLGRSRALRCTIAEHHPNDRTTILTAEGIIKDDGKSDGTDYEDNGKRFEAGLPRGCRWIDYSEYVLGFAPSNSTSANLSP
jgi:hypothetical protein